MLTHGHSVSHGTVIASITLWVEDCDGEPALYTPDAYWLRDRHHGHAGLVYCADLAPLLFHDA